MARLSMVTTKHAHANCADVVVTDLVEARLCFSIIPAPTRGDAGVPVAVNLIVGDCATIRNLQENTRRFRPYIAAVLENIVRERDVVGHPCVIAPVVTLLWERRVGRDTRSVTRLANPCTASTGVENEGATQAAVSNTSAKVATEAADVADREVVELHLLSEHEVHCR